ncbi:hypothetical protein BASA81_003320 [Batrachochytrium salamandrivorans]|nr:hypothetical protein BASA81_003320 [Batrachochytrium salamandrivorans]
MQGNDDDFALAAKQQEEIQKHVTSQALIGPFELGFASLQAELGAGFQPGLVLLTKSHRGWHRVRGDGNCFFRAFMFSLVSQLQLAKHAGELARLSEFMSSSLDLLEQAGYERLGVETFQEMTSDFFRDDLLSCQPLDVFNNQGESEHLVWFARLLCATNLRLHSDRFLPFIPSSPASMVDYCQREVEPQGKECGQMEILALAELLQVQVQIEYLSSTACTSTTFGPESGMPIHLLYRPGHYDILGDKYI